MSMLMIDISCVHDDGADIPSICVKKMRFFGGGGGGQKFLLPKNANITKTSLFSTRNITSYKQKKPEKYDLVCCIPILFQPS